MVVAAARVGERVSIGYFQTKFLTVWIAFSDVPIAPSIVALGPFFSATFPRSPWSRTSYNESGRCGRQRPPRCRPTVAEG